MSQIDPAARAALLVPESTRTNYITEIRRAAVARGISVDAARTEKVKAWRTQHENEPLGGYDVLADWLEGADLGALDAVDPAELAKARALESAKRDPANPQAAILDTSDAEVRKEIDLARDTAAAGASADAPVITKDGAEIPAGRVDAVLAGDVKPSEAAKPGTGSAKSSPAK
ncbi:hypothetical protein [Paractinoplanes atraurantiacus]|uniref:Uncharacterized protein n=1 Tax=Paractinoplanes atraurantiacus TaxID=1036182 RepID=A0A285GZX2_9ACTN|nr:hypothetical protein [Actinoplanes atraurantiacus]SNY29018.1 hypothetical protein SAMN05421748_103177 [Actinoplanes atraurantiacus]